MGSFNAIYRKKQRRYLLKYLVYVAGTGVHYNQLSGVNFKFMFMQKNYIWVQGAN